uniref:guanine nucleotide-binding protein subunit gamma 3 n=1 Tax=Erigeron canadensis TaxID=72917 RepID=UPI001CB9A0B9|nr:guanine nucleotide-binding protein subunit gamma 3 [Erigeron canadensis]
MTMVGGTSNDSSSSSNMSPVSSPSSSIVIVDLYGKRRQFAKVQVLEREISLLQDEIKSLAELELASRCCKELNDYVEATPDPLIALNKTHGRSRNFWKNVRRKTGSIMWWCCCCGCCKKTVCCSCCPRVNDCWSCGQLKPCTTDCCKCPEISCHCNCSCNPSCPKCSVCCCCKPCLCL